MLENIARALYYLQIHLLYASLVGFAAWILTAIPRASATTKDWIWVATSLNFLLPAGALVDRVWASQLSWASPLGTIGQVANGIAHSRGAGVLGGLWVLGATLMFSRLYLRLTAERRELERTRGEGGQSRRRTFFAQGIRGRFAESRRVPTVDGALRPHLSLPDGIDRLLTRDELTPCSCTN